jgi:hypothetical protein
MKTKWLRGASTWVAPPPTSASGARTDLLTRPAEHLRPQAGRRLVVAIDGRTASGKTTFADELAEALSRPCRPYFARASMTLSSLGGTGISMTGKAGRPGKRGRLLSECLRPFTYPLWPGRRIPCRPGHALLTPTPERDGEAFASPMNQSAPAVNWMVLIPRR